MSACLIEVDARWMFDRKVSIMRCESYSLPISRSIIRSAVRLRRLTFDNTLASHENNLACVTRGTRTNMKALSHLVASWSFLLLVVARTPAWKRGGALLRTIQLAQVDSIENRINRMFAWVPLCVLIMNRWKGFVGPRVRDSSENN